MMMGSGGPPTPSSAGPSTPTRYSAGPSTPSSRDGECSNCKLLANELMVLKTILEMYRHPENHTGASADLLEQLYDKLGKLRM